MLIEPEADTPTPAPRYDFEGKYALQRLQQMKAKYHALEDKFRQYEDQNNLLHSENKTLAESLVSSESNN